MPKVVHRRGTPGPNHPNGMGGGKGMPKGVPQSQSQIVRRSQKVSANSATRLAKRKG